MHSIFCFFPMCAGALWSFGQAFFHVCEMSWFHSTAWRPLQRVFLVALCKDDRQFVMRGNTMTKWIFWWRKLKKIKLKLESSVWNNLVCIWVPTCKDLHNGQDVACTVCASLWSRLCQQNLANNCLKLLAWFQNFQFIIKIPMCPFSTALFSYFQRIKTCLNSGRNNVIIKKNSNLQKILIFW